MSASAVALTGLVLWSLILTYVLIVARFAVFTGGNKALNTFQADGRDLPAYGQRITRAHANSLEYLAIPVGLLGLAIIMGRTDITDGLALVVLAARIAQSLAHMLSTSKPMVLVRASFFFVQLLIWTLWAVKLITA